MSAHAVRIEHRPAAQDGWLPKWWVVCSCGYRSTSRYAELTAVRDAVHHARKYLEAAPVT
jgi:hypothetical protein